MTRVGRFVALALAVTLASASPLVRAQETIPGVRVEMVHLDAVVTDKDGKLVRDLAAEDFLILEDGKPQKVALFSAGGRRRATASPAMGEGATVTATAVSGTPSESGPGRHVVIVVDDLHIAPPHLEYAKRALAQFLDQFTADDDQVALITTSSSGSVPLSSEKTRVRWAIGALRARESTVAPTRSTQMSPAQAEMVLSGDSAAIRLAARAMLDEPGSVYEAQDLTPRSALVRDAGLLGINDPRERVAAEEARRQAAPVLAEALRFSVASLAVIEQALRSLASLPGRKLCLVISDGFLVGAGTREERTHDLEIVVDAATRSGAVVYALDSRGLMTSGGDAAIRSLTLTPGVGTSVDRQSEQRLRSTLERLSEGTGGFLITRTNDLVGGLRQMLEDNETYYLLAYEPANVRREGRFRRIEVRLPRHSGLTVRTRRGYLEPDDRRRAAPATIAASTPAAVPVPVPDALSEEQARALLAAPPPPDGIAVRLSADYVDLPPSGPQAVVHAHVDTAKLTWREEGGRRRAEVDLVGGVYDETGKAVAGPFGRRTEIDVSATDAPGVSATGLEFKHQLPLAPGRYEVRFFAREVGPGRRGGSSQRLEVPDLANKKLMMSAVFLASATSPSSEGETLRDAQARRVFPRGASVSFQLYVYNAAVDDKGASDVVLQAQIWSGGKVIAASKTQPAGLQRKDGVPVPETNVMSLEGLEPGGYELRVVVVDRKASLQILRRTDFTVE